MLDFTFSLPTKVIFGRQAQKQLPDLLAAGGARKVLLHTYAKEVMDQFPIYSEIKALLKDAGIAYVELPGVQPNPTLAFIGEGIELCRAEGVNYILAVGGGSVIDSAKGIALGVNTSLDEVWAYVEGTQTPDPAKTLGLGVVLTTAAAGSETSTAAVITNEKLGAKRGAHHEANRPSFAILNPEITCSVPAFQTACGVFDSMMHACERYFTESCGTPLTDRINEAIMKSVWEAGHEVMRNLKDYDTRATLMWAASLAHNNLAGCGRLKGSGLHLMEEELHAVKHDIVHGAGLSVLFPAWARQLYKRAPMRFAQFAVRVWNVEMDYENPEKTALLGIEAMEAFITYLGLPRRLEEIGVLPEHFDTVVQRCTANGRKVSNLCEVSPQDVMEILERAK